MRTSGGQFIYEVCVNEYFNFKKYNYFRSSVLYEHPRATQAFSRFVMKVEIIFMVGRWN
jgi:hypothetical protein